MPGPIQSDKFPQDRSIEELRKGLRREFRNLYDVVGGSTGRLLPLPPDVSPVEEPSTPSELSWDFGSLAVPAGPSVDFGDFFVPLAILADFGAL